MSLHGLISTRRASAGRVARKGPAGLGERSPGPAASGGDSAAAQPGWEAGALPLLPPPPACLPPISLPCLPLGFSCLSQAPSPPISLLSLFTPLASLSLSPPACLRSPRPSAFKIIFRTPRLCAVSAQSLDAQRLRSGDGKSSFSHRFHAGGQFPAGCAAHGHCGRWMHFLGSVSWVDVCWLQTPAQRGDRKASYHSGRQCSGLVSAGDEASGRRQNQGSVARLAQGSASSRAGSELELELEATPC